MSTRREQQRQEMAIRAREVANYIIENKATIRQAAIQFDVSKSTIHIDITERLPHIDPKLALTAKLVLEYNDSIKHIRGGQATREKNAQLKSKIGKN